MSAYAIESAVIFFVNLPASAVAQPAGPSVVAGQAQISTSGATTLITQSTSKAIINWQDFSVASGSTVQFAQPGASSITLNRVTGSSVSTINGSVLANGQVWLLNSNGVLFGQGSSIHVGGLLATTSDIANNDFLSGNYSFSGGGSGAIVNNGTIKAAKGGSVVLSAPNVANTGLVQATAGHVVLAGTDTFTVDFKGDHLLSYAVGASTQTGTVTNSGIIKAAGGQVLLTARAAAGVADGVINNTGMVEATSVRKGENGEIILDAGDGTAETSGTLDASGKAAGQTGGSVQVLGQTVAVTDGAKIDVSGDAGGGTALIGGNFHGAGPQANAQTTTVGKAIISANAINSGNGGKVAVYSVGTTQVAATITAKGSAGGTGGQVETSGHFLNFDGSSIDAGVGGTWLLDPYDLTVDTTAASSINTSLGAGTSVTLQTTASGTSGPGNANASGNGDILINAPLTWTGAATLTLSAYRNIQFNANVTVQTSGGVVISPATGGAGDYFFAPGYSLSFSALTSAPTLQIGGVSYTLVSSIAQLASSIAANSSGKFALANNYNASGDGTYSTSPISTSFAGSFTGLGNTVANLSISSTGSIVGLFSTVSGTVRDIILSNANVSASGNVGALVGDAALGSTIQSSNSTGTVTGGTAGYTGGLVGQNLGTVFNDYSTATVIGGNGSYIGGLVGYNTGNISRSFASGAVSGGGGSGCCIGGLVGQNNAGGGTITDSYATGAVTSNAGGYAGGLVGHNNGGVINTSYATGVVSGAPSNFGGLVGSNDNGGAINGSYWDSDTNATDNSGSGASSLTTAQLTSILPSGFDGQWANGPNATSPYLLNNQAGSVLIGSSATTRYSVIFTMAQMQAINGDLNVNDSSATLAANYTLARNIDAAGTSGWIPLGVNATGTIIGSGFTGIFDGLGNTISNLTINNATQSNQGLFGYASGGTIRNLGIVGGSVTGSSDVGGLVGQTNSETISNDYTTGNVTGSGNFVGGLMGQNGGTISNSYATGNVSVSGTGQYDVGGLVGQGGGSISLSYATGNVTAGAGNDGLGGYDGAGGLIGQSSGTISQSYATGTVTGGTGTVHVGGLVGWNNGGISNSYAMGAVSSGANAQGIGGLLGLAVSGGSISNSYSTGAVTGGAGASALGGFIGQNLGGSTITANYWNTQTSGLSTDGSGSGATGMNSTSLQSNLPSGFSASVWGTGPGLYPYLLWRYATTPQKASGIAYSDRGVTPLASTYGAPVTVSVLANGASFGTATTGADGSFYTIAPAGTIPSTNGQVLAYVTTGGTGNTLADNASGSVGNFKIYGNTLLVMSAGSPLSTIVTDLATARGTATGTAFLYTAPLTLNAGANFELDSTGSLTVDTALTTMSGSVVLDANTFNLGGAVNITSAITTNGGALTIGGGVAPLLGAAIGTATQNNGINISAALSSGGGAITINGTGSNMGGVGVNIAQAVSAGGGNIAITGTGGSASGSSYFGIAQGFAGIVSTTGSGNIILNGTGGGTGTNEVGYFTNANVTAVTGNIAITGAASPTATGTIDHGIDVNAGTISTGGTGTITLMGTATGNGTGANTYGVLFNTSTGVAATNGLISITGTNNSTGTGSGNNGVFANTATIISNGTGGITINGTGGGTGSAGADYGVFLQTANAIQTPGGAAISLTGNGGDTGGTGTLNTGVYVGAALGVGGNLSITGTGGGPGGAINAGISLPAAVTASGTITLNSTGTVTASGALTATGLQLLGAGGSYMLTNASNTVTTLAANTGSVTYAQTGALNIGTAGSTNGLTTTGAITLTVAGSVTQSQGIAATGLELLGAGGSYMLTNVGNAVTTLAANTGSVTYAQTGALNIGTTGSTSGLTTTGAITLTVAGAVTQSWGIAATDLNITTTGSTSTITLNDGGSCCTGPVDNGNQISGTARFNSGSNVTYTSSYFYGPTVIGNSVINGNLTVSAGSYAVGINDASGSLSVTGNTTLFGGSFSQTIPIASQNLTVTASNGNIVLTNGTNQVTGIVEMFGNSDGGASGYFTNSVSTLLGNSSIRNNLTVVTSGTLTLQDSSPTGVNASAVSLQAASGISQSTTSPYIAAGSLSALSVGGSVTLASTNNAITGTVTLGSATTGSIAFYNSVATTLGAVSGLGAAYSPTAGGSATILSPNGGITLTGLVQMSGSTQLVSGSSGITETGAGQINSGSLTVQSSGALDIALTQLLNTVTGSVSLISRGNVSFANSVSTSLSSSTAGGILTVQSGGNLTIQSGATLASQASAGTVGVVLAAAGNFINNSGSGALQFSNGANFLIYSATPANDVFGGLNSNNMAIWNTASLTPVSASGSRYVFALQPTLSVAANNISKTYGVDASAALTGSYTVSGLQPGVANAYLGDTAAAVYSGTVALTSAGVAASAGVGTYAITVDASKLTVMDGYAPGGQTGASVTVNPATLTYFANSGSRIYGAASPAYTGTVTGFANGDTQASATTGALAFATTAIAASNVGSYAINGSGLSASNYTFVQAAGNATALTINPAILTYTANAASRLYGQANAAFSGIVSGFVNSDTQASATSGSAVFASLATAASNVGSYAINGGGLIASANYVFAQAAGNAAALTINPATLTYVANAASRVYGQANGILSGLVSGFVNNDTLASATTGTLTFGSTAIAASNVGFYAINGSGLLATNYTFTQAANNATALTVNPATLTIALTGQVSKIFDGTTAATLSAANYTALSGVLGTDAVALAAYPTTGAYDTSAVGTGKVVTVAGLALTGAKAVDYIIANSISGAVGTITAPATTIVATIPVTPTLSTLFNTASVAGVPTLAGFTAALTTPPAPAPPQQPAPNPPPPQVITPLTVVSALTPLGDLSSQGGNQPSDPPSSSDQTTSYVAQSLDGGPPPKTNVGGAADGIVIPHFLSAHAALPASPLNPGALPSWGNAGLWN